jgi:hypothetical protein
MSDAIFQRGRHVIPIRTLTDRFAAVTVLLLDLRQVCSLYFAFLKAVLRPVELLFGVKSSVCCADEFSFRNPAIAHLKGPVDSSCIRSVRSAIEDAEIACCWTQRVEIRADEGLASIRCRSGLCLCALIQHPTIVPLRIHRSPHLFPSLAE